MLITKKKIILLVGSIVLVLGVLIFLYLYKFKSSSVDQTQLSAIVYPILVLGVFMIMYGLKMFRFIPALVILVFSIFICLIFWYYYIEDDWFREIISFSIGVPSGIITALLFLVSNYFLITKKKPNIKFKEKVILQIPIYFVILIFVNLIFKLFVQY